MEINAIRRNLFVCIILFLCCSTINFGQKYQTKFLEGNFKTKTAIPKQIFSKLKNNYEVQDCIKAGAEIDFTDEWFIATKINLNSDKYPDLLIKATKGCLEGNAISFWFFTNDHGIYKQVLYDYTLVINISSKKTNGLNNIETRRSAGMETFMNKYAFNGRTFLKRRSYSVPFIH